MSIIILLTGAVALEALYNGAEWIVNKRYNKTHNKRKMGVYHNG